jgi:hypothetical protein
VRHQTLSANVTSHALYDRAARLLQACVRCTVNPAACDLKALVLFCFVFFVYFIYMFAALLGVVCRFVLHRLFNVLAVLSATAGVVIAWIKFDSLDSVSIGEAHKLLAYAAWILVLILPIAGLVRPRKPEYGQKRSKLRLVWEIGHKGLGCASVSVAVGDAPLCVDNTFTIRQNLREAMTALATWTQGTNTCCMRKLPRPFFWL